MNGIRKGECGLREAEGKGGYPNETGVAGRGPGTQSPIDLSVLILRAMGSY